MYFFPFKMYRTVLCIILCLIAVALAAPTKNSVSTTRSTTESNGNDSIYSHSEGGKFFKWVGIFSSFSLALSRFSEQGQYGLTDHGSTGLICVLHHLLSDWLHLSDVLHGHQRGKVQQAGTDQAQSCTSWAFYNHLNWSSFKLNAERKQRQAGYLKAFQAGVFFSKEREKAKEAQVSSNSNGLNWHFLILPIINFNFIIKFCLKNKIGFWFLQIEFWQGFST